MQTRSVRSPRLLSHHLMKAPDDRPPRRRPQRQPQPEGVDRHGVGGRGGVEIMQDADSQRRKGVARCAGRRRHAMAAGPIQHLQSSLQRGQRIRLRTNVPHLFYMRPTPRGVSSEAVGPSFTDATTARLSGARYMLESLMGFNSIRRGMLATLMASFIALFVLVPAVDAMSCGTEGESSETAVLVVDDHGDEPHPVDDANHAFCTHGHCHHGGVSTPARQDASLDIAPRRGALLTDPSRRLVSHPPAGPERPPRA